MTDITYTIANLERTPDGVVSIVHYRIDAVDGEYTSGAYGTLNVSGSASDEGFIAFESLTEADVVGWVKAEFGEERVAEIETALQAKIDEQKTPQLISGLAW